MSTILDKDGLRDADASLVFDLQQAALREAAYALRAVLIETDDGVRTLEQRATPYSGDSYLPCGVVIAVREALEKCQQFLQ